MQDIIRVLKMIFKKIMRRFRIDSTSSGMNSLGRYQVSIMKPGFIRNQAQTLLSARANYITFSIPVRESSSFRANFRYSLYIASKTAIFFFVIRLFAGDKVALEFFQYFPILNQRGALTFCLRSVKSDSLADNFH